MSNSRPIALITGASSGIGRELACGLAADHDLILTARRETELRALAVSLSPTVCHVIPADLADPAAPQALYRAVQSAGLIVDVLVNNAGFGDLGPFAEADLQRALRMIQVNVTALTELTGLFLPGMRQRGRGRILNVGSVAGFQPGPFMAVYYATKAYVNSFSEALWSELKGSGVTVTCLAPGRTESAFAATAGFDLRAGGGAVASARSVAELGIRAMKRGKRMVVPGFWNRVLLCAERFVPRSVVISAVRRMQLARQG
jgi:short-subunit dehydrogenase